MNEVKKVEIPFAIPFYTKYGTYGRSQKIEKTPTGEKTQVEHTPHMGKDGKRTLIADNPKPIYEMIQAHREETEIERIVKRALQGDMSVLNAMEGNYMDITGAPKSLAEAQQIIVNAKRDFEKLDPEIREKFGNNVEVFIAEAGSKDWCDKLGITEAMETEKATKAKKAKFEKNLEDAMENLATGKATVKVEEGAE